MRLQIRTRAGFPDVLDLTVCVVTFNNAATISDCLASAERALVRGLDSRNAILHLDEVENRA